MGGQVGPRGIFRRRLWKEGGFGSTPLIAFPLPRRYSNVVRRTKTTTRQEQLPVAGIRRRPVVDAGIARVSGVVEIQGDGLDGDVVGIARCRRPLSRRWERAMEA